MAEQVKFKTIEELNGEETRSDWEAKQGSTDGEKLDLADHGGDPEIIREFKIQLPPKQKGQEPLSNDQIVTAHRRNILNMLHTDGFEPTSELKGLRKGKFFHIFVSARVERSITGKGAKYLVNEKPETLKNIMTKHHAKNS